MNTRYIQKSALDQFYTNENIAKECYGKVVKMFGDSFSRLIEPSAGTGSFYRLFPKNKRLGIDLDPKCEGVIEQDFLLFNLERNNAVKIATIGNPPFGKNSSLAVKFFNAAAEFSDVIAFIVPKTFRKKSLRDRLHRNFHLRYDSDLSKNAFVLNNEPYDVPCCFQIWERTISKRKISKPSLENDFFYFVKKDAADLAVRRVGGRTGKATKDVNGCAEVSHHFLKMKEMISTDLLLEVINAINFDRVINSTAGVKSLSKPELVRAITKWRENR